MLISILVILTAWYWLMIESDFLRIHLLTGVDYIKPDYSGECKLEIVSGLDTDTMSTPNYKYYNPDVKMPVYKLALSPGIKPMCYEWLRDNYNKLVTFKPRIELDYGSYRQQITFNGGEYAKIMKQIMKLHDKKFITQMGLI